MEQNTENNYIDNIKLAAYSEASAKSILVNGKVSGRQVAANISKSLKFITAFCQDSRQRFKDCSIPSAIEWLLDNYYLVRQNSRTAKCDFSGTRSLPSSGKDCVIILACQSLISAGADNITDERCILFLSAFQSVLQLSETELNLFPSALRGAMITELALSCSCEIPNADRISALFKGIRSLDSLNFRRIIEETDTIEQVFLKDPSGIYPRMDDNTRSAYRRETAMLSNRMNLSEYDTAAEILQLSQQSNTETEKHIGHWIYSYPIGKNRRYRTGAYYITANTLLPLFLSLLSGFIFRDPLVPFLFLLPVSELTKRVLDYFLLQSSKPKPVLRMSLIDGVPPEGKTICVFSTLLSDSSDVHSLTEKLECAFLSNRDCGGNLLFGLLADYPESLTSTQKSDEIISDAARNAIDTLNEKYNGQFFLFIRNRSLYPSDNIFRGKERKRGALIDLAKLTAGQNNGLLVLSGTVNTLAGTHYIITLDSDTELLPGSAAKMIGAMLHPLNRPIVDHKRGIVVAGHGIYHPRMTVSLSASMKTDFSRIFAGQAGSNPYSTLCSELYMDFFSRGGFSGKGILDINSFLECCTHFPENRILSHDALEGAYLRGGYMGDCELFDSFPSKTRSYFSREHRWTRGDWQNLPWIFSAGKHLSDIDRYKLFDNLRRSLIPLSTFIVIFLGFFIDSIGLHAAAVVSLITLTSRLFASLAEGAAKKSSDIGMRFYTAQIFGIGGAIMQTFFKLWLLPYEAYVCTSAVITSIWRMTLTHKNMLEWQTAAQSENHSGNIVFIAKDMWFSVFIGSICAFLSPSIIGRTAGLIWFFSPLCAWALSLPAEKRRSVSGIARRYLTECAEQTWEYFDVLCNASENHLPPDNYQSEPPVGVAHRTSPTNIGLALISCLAAIDLGIDNRLSAVNHIGKILSTVSSLPKCHGHLLNWYDTCSLKPLFPEYVSTVDSGNLFACLITLKTGLMECGENELAEIADQLAYDMDFSFLYDNDRNLFRVGYDISKSSYSDSWYDLLSSESRLTSYIACAKGDVPIKHWRCLGRIMLKKDNFRGLASWSGTMFEYLMPNIFLPLIPGSIFHESSSFCVYAQKKCATHYIPWGVSESAYFSLDNELNYQYKANGCPFLSLKREQNSCFVISPYSSFLALDITPNAAIKNLKKLEKLSMRSDFGFYEALDFTPSRCRGRNGEIVKCHMAHHQGMSLASTDNYLQNNIMQRRFMSDRAMYAFKSLLEEQTPTGGAAVSKSKVASFSLQRKQINKWRNSGETADFKNPECCIISNGLYRVMLTECGQTASFFRNIEIYRSPIPGVSFNHGMDIDLECNGKTYSLLPEPGTTDFSYKWEFSQTSALFSSKTALFHSSCSVAVPARHQGEIRIIDLNADTALSGNLHVVFDPVLAPQRDYQQHPLFWHLGLYSKDRDNSLLIRRLSRNGHPETWMCIASDVTISYSAGRNVSLGWLTNPCITISVPVLLTEGEHLSIRLCIALGLSEDEAYNSAQLLLATGPSGLADMPGKVAELTGMDLHEISSAMVVFKRLWLSRVHSAPAKDTLWRYGISGDLPIMLANSENIDEALQYYCLLRRCGFESDLAIITDEVGDYSRPTINHINEFLEKIGLTGLLNINSGIHIIPPESYNYFLSCSSCKIGDGAESHSESLECFLPHCGQRGSVPSYSFENGTFSFYINHTLPPRCWVNVLSNGEFGYIAADSGSGHMWYLNSREFPINSWSNDSYSTVGPETLELTTSQWRRSLFAAGDGWGCMVKYGFGWATYNRGSSSFGVSLTAFVPPDINARVLIIEPRGDVHGTIRWKTDITMGCKSGISITYANSIFSAANSRSFIPDTVFYSAFSEKPKSYTCDYFRFLQHQPDNTTTFDTDPIISAEWEFNGPIVIVCGCDDTDKIKQLANYESAKAALNNVSEHWKNTLSRFNLKCNNDALTHLMNGWAAYQTICCRLLARTSIYQSGGAYGFRDQLQDAVNMLLMSKEPARAQILMACEHQYEEGDVMHWWHTSPSGDHGVRTHCSDDLLWLVWALCEYTEKTGDVSICSEECHYLSSPVLSFSVHDRYEAAAKTKYTEPIIYHALKAMEMCINRGDGNHGLLKFGSCDWNDGMNNIDGESVWLTWFFSHVSARFSKLLEKLSMPEKNYYMKMSVHYTAIADSCWDGGWYLRGYWANGQKIGSKDCKCCRIDSISQSWAAMCQGTDERKVSIALSNAVQLLFDRKNQIIKLFDPPFTDCSPSPGYIESYGPGFRENGGQYTHGAIWLAIACLKRGLVADGKALLDAIMPENHNLEIFEAEPFILPADIYSNPDHYGKAGWTWYTGSSGWFFRAVTEDLLGIKLHNGKVTVTPNLDNYSVVWTDYENKEHKINVKNRIVFIDGERQKTLP